MDAAAPTLLRLPAFLFIEQEPRQDREKEGAEFAFRRVRRLDGILFQQPREKFLSQILRVSGSKASPLNEGVDRWPIPAAQKFQRLDRTCRVGLSRRQHHAPAGGMELSSNLTPF